MIRGAKAVIITIDGDANVHELNQRLRDVVEWNGLRTVERLGFGVLEGKITIAARLMGDDWDLAIVVAAMRLLSSEYPHLVFRFELDPGSPKLRLTRGQFGPDEKAVASFLRTMDCPRHDKCEFRSIVVTVRGPTRDSMREALLESYARLRTKPRITFDHLRDELRIAVALDGEHRAPIGVLRELAMAWMRASDPPAEELQCHVDLVGHRTRSRAIAWLADWIALEKEFRTAD